MHDNFIKSDSKYDYINSVYAFLFWHSYQPFVIFEIIYMSGLWGSNQRGSGYLLPNIVLEDSYNEVEEYYDDEDEEYYI